MKKLIVYGTQYGTTKRYAEKFSEIMDLPCMSYMSLFKISSDGPRRFHQSKFKKSVRP